MEQIQTNLLFTEQLIIGFLFAAVVALLLKGLTIGIAYAKTKAELIKDERARKIVLATLDSVDTLIRKNITNSETTLKPAILQDIADGKVDKSELSSLSTIVKDNVLKQLSTDSTKVLNTTVGDINSYLSVSIEDTLATMKADDSNTIVTKTVIPEATVATVDSTELQNANIQLTDANTQLSATNVQLVADNAALKAKVDTITAALNSTVQA